MRKIYYALAILFIVSAPPVSGQQFEVMVYTSPDQWHDATVPAAINEFREMALKHDFGLNWTQQPDDFTDDQLQDMDVIVFLQSTGDRLSEEQKDSFKRFIRNGGGFVGIHAASVSAGQEEWYQKLVGRVFVDHPPVLTAVMKVTDKNHPSTMHLPERWMWTDEWYSFGEALTDNQQVLITVDETTFNPDRTGGNEPRFTSMGDFHPIAWYQEFDGGRSFYTSLGHIPASFSDPWFLAHIYGGIHWAATGLGIYE